jgi:hypothetical protein
LVYTGSFVGVSSYRTHMASNKRMEGKSAHFRNAGSSTDFAPSIGIR